MLLYPNILEAQHGKNMFTRYNTMSKITCPWDAEGKQCMLILRDPVTFIILEYENIFHVSKFLNILLFCLGFFLMS